MNIPEENVLDRDMFWKKIKEVGGMKDEYSEKKTVWVDT